MPVPEAWKTCTEVFMVKAKPLPPVHALQQRFYYEPETGLLKYAVRLTRPYIEINSIAGRPKNNGYLQVMFQKKALLVHRVAWKLHTKQEPPAVIDHINGDVMDNRWVNLREADYHTNQGNRRHDRSRGRFLPGAWPRHNKWQAMARGNYIGMYESEIEAHEAYVAWHVTYFGEHSIYAKNAS
jgi:hypothetical protein